MPFSAPSSLTVGTVTTLSPGASATVANSGSATAAVFDIGIPQGTTGAAGTNGTDPGVRWLFATSTTMADPSAGNVRFNNATLASVTAIAISYSSGETGNPSFANTVKSWDDSTTTANRGYLILKKASASQNYIVFNITAALTDNTTWAQFTVAVLDSAGTLAASDVLSVQWSRTGDAGSGSLSGMTANGIMYATGASAGTSTAAATDGQILIGKTGLAPALAALSGDVTMTNAGVTAIGALKVLGSMIAAATIDLTTKVLGILPVANGGTGLSSLGTGVATFLGTPTSANLAAALTDETGTGANVFANTPTLVTPVLGAATATSINGNTFTTGTYTLTGVAGKTLTFSNTLTFAGTDATTMTFPATSSTVLTTGNNATITKGYYVTPNNIGTVSSGTTTPDAANGNYQYYTNNGAHTLAVPASDCAIDILITNGASAGAITFSGSYTVSSSTGDALTTTNTNKFILSIRRINAVSTYVIKALQ